jgi:hypothetical protein
MRAEEAMLIVMPGKRSVLSKRVMGDITFLVKHTINSNTQKCSRFRCHESRKGGMDVRDEGALNLSDSFIKLSRSFTSCG